MNQTTVITTPWGISRFRLLVLRGALKLEVKGMRHSRGVSAYATVKRLGGFTGDRAAVLAHFEAWLQAQGYLAPPAPPHCGCGAASIRGKCADCTD